MAISRFLSAALVGCSVCVSSALAADMPVKAVSTKAYNWTGFYLGGNAGGHWAKDDDPAYISDNNSIFPSIVTQLNQLAPVSLSPTGFTGGVQLGYNWQISSFVVGVEGDFEGITGSASRALNTVVTTPLGGTSPVQFVDSAKMRWMATLRGRLGFTADRLFIYGTGGAAWSEWETSHSFANSVLFGPAGAVSSTFTRSGWVIGGGLEYAFLDNWLVRVEYLHADFGSHTSTLVTSIAGLPGAVTNFTHPEKLTDNIVRVGISHKFGGP